MTWGDAADMRLSARRPALRLRLGGNGWLAATLLIVVLGTSGSYLAARAVARGDARRSQKAFAASAADVGSTLKVSIAREEDLVVSTRAFLGTNPRITNAGFKRWEAADLIVQRYPELIGLVRIVIVPRAQLAAYAASAVKNPSGTLGPGGEFQVLPAGSRPFYCFADLSGRLPPKAVRQPVGRDLCANGAGAALLAARDSGQSTYLSFKLGGHTGLDVETPVYRGGGVPATVAARRAAFAGWVGIVLEPSVVLVRVRETHPALALAMRFGAPKQAVTFTNGQIPKHFDSVTEQLGSGWSVQTFGAANKSGVLSNMTALAVLLGGGLVSLLAGLLGVVLATGRARARRQVHEQTVELRDQSVQLHASVAELKAAQAVKDEFFAVVSHELRTPMTSIIGFTDMLQGEDLTDEQHKHLDVIDRNAGRLLRLVDDLLLMAEIQSGGLPLQLGEVILSDLIARSSESVKMFAASKEIDLEIETEPGVTAEADPRRLGQVLDNLMTNAIKYTPNGGDVAITMSHTDETATIAITDNGIGIPKDEQSQMFNRFFRTSNARGTGVAGTGLGLAISRGIVEAHGGTIGFDSDEGRGTTFRVTLPLTHALGFQAVA